MPGHDDLDERIARLQRAAYGAGVPDDERRAAAAELAGLRPEADDRVRSGDPAPPADSPEDGDDGASAEERGGPASRAGLVVTTVIALLAGLAAGWTLDAVVSRGDGIRALRASETEAWRVFDSPAPRGDRVRYPAPPVGVDLDRDSRRLLAARSDGVRLIAVRSEDGRDACLVLVMPSGPSAAACTVDGRFPGEGLEVETDHPDTGAFSATWDATGRVSLGPAGTGD
ncbi:MULTISPECIES: hypothetical protein [unclassified Agromyces]|uniref:hypothetical protein n=1 Tax=unclassified Agromyces TaxID=2639701 RepID=UPI003014CABB